MSLPAEREEHGPRWLMAPTDDGGQINSAGLAHLLEQVKQAPCRCLMLDLRGARVLRAYDVKLLVHAREALRGRRVRLRIVARAGSEVARLLKQHQLDQLFFRCDNRQESGNDTAAIDTAST